MDVDVLDQASGVVGQPRQYKHEPEPQQQGSMVAQQPFAPVQRNAYGANAGMGGGYGDQPQQQQQYSTSASVAPRRYASMSIACVSFPCASHVGWSVAKEMGCWQR